VVDFSVKEMGGCQVVSIFFNLYCSLVLTEGEGIAYDALAKNVNNGFASVSANGVSQSLCRIANSRLVEILTTERDIMVLVENHFIRIQVSLTTSLGDRKPIIPIKRRNKMLTRSPVSAPVQ
jgi:hypothetical protein